ncbi:STAS domain-containing protein [Alkalibacillus silvisoli]|uniref:STAS domain-containing protein n=1 Tax=Alkalibacillus silvisoli TaxID=392823 RepID=A0ABP3JVI9_9BACI
MSLEIKKLNTDQGDYELVLSGVLDISTRSTFDEVFDSLVDLQSLKLNLEELEFIDSTGVGGIMEIIFASNERGFQLTVLNINDNIEEILSTLGVFTIMESLQVERCST